MADKEAAPTTEEAIVVCLHPDVCRRGDSTVAYDIIARESDDVEHSTDVKITGCWASHEGARLKTVYQDAPGDAGIKSGCVEGYARPVKNTSCAGAATRASRAGTRRQPCSSTASRACARRRRGCVRIELHDSMQGLINDARRVLGFEQGVETDEVPLNV